MVRAKRARVVPGELALIEAIRRRAAATRKGALRMGIGDDCAVLRPRVGYEVCVTTDFSLEGRHFRRGWHSPQSAGHRCLARGLSDLAAMGAEPMAVFLSLAVPANTPAAWVDGFLDGLLALARRYKVSLAGGDTAESPEGIAADIVALGQVPAGAARMRSGARPGDAIYVTGALGGAAAELAALARQPAQVRELTRAAAGHPHLFPEPRLAVGRRLRGMATAMIDISDGLSTDLTHLCQASGVAAEIEEATLPIHPLASPSKEALRLALHGGEDYELLFTARPKTRIPEKIAGVKITAIGEIVTDAKSRLYLTDSHGQRKRLIAAGWQHLA